MNLISRIAGIALAMILVTDVSAQQAFRTDGGDDSLPWFQLKEGEFPPKDSAHYFSGELIRVDHLEREFILRVDRTDAQRRSHFDLPVAASMLPYGSLAYHGSPAALKDIPLGTHLHGWFYQRDPSEEYEPIEGWHNRKSIEVDFTRCFRLEDDFSYHAKRDEIWRIDDVDLDQMELTCTLLHNGKSIDDPKVFELQRSTRIWNGRGIGELADLQSGQQILFNLTWATLYGPGRVTEIWLDESSRALATAHQLEKHRMHIRQRGIPGWVDQVDNKERIVTITFFGGIDEQLFNDLKEGTSAGIAVARHTLMTYDPVNDRKRGPIVKVTQVEQQPGGSGLQVQIKPDLLLEGFRPKRIVRVYPASWPVIALPKEEEYFGR